MSEGPISDESPTPSTAPIAAHLLPDTSSIVDGELSVGGVAVTWLQRRVKGAHAQLVTHATCEARGQGFAEQRHEGTSAGEQNQNGEVAAQSGVGVTKETAQGPGEHHGLGNREQDVEHAQRHRRAQRAAHQRGGAP